jgi:NAD-dependent SIR2 family protein deacetylase
MYRCNNCFADFEESEVIREDAGEKWSVCPYCRGTDFGEIRPRKEDDAFLKIKKSEVIDFVVSAIAFINAGETDSAKETLVELIGEMMESYFEYKQSLALVSDKKAAEELRDNIITMLEVEVV